jgi:hypothetical protein
MCERKPCWFYNNGGCKKEDCVFSHVYISGHVPPDPENIPCWFFHIVGHCKFREGCTYNHKELSPKEWKRYFPGVLIKHHYEAVEQPLGQTSIPCIRTTWTPGWGNSTYPRVSEKSFHSKNLEPITDELVKLNKYINQLKNSKLGTDKLNEILKLILKNFVSKHLLVN